MIGVLVSGEGTNLQALIDASLPIVAVASNKAGARALERAEQAGIATAAFELDDHPDREARTPNTRFPRITFCPPTNPRWIPPPSSSRCMTWRIVL